MEKINLIAMRGEEAYFYYRMLCVETGENPFIANSKCDMENFDAYLTGCSYIPWSSVWSNVAKNEISGFIKIKRGKDCVVCVDADIRFVGFPKDYNEEYLKLFEKYGEVVNEETIALAANELKSKTENLAV